MAVLTGGFGEDVFFFWGAFDWLSGAMGNWVEIINQLLTQPFLACGLPLDAPETYSGFWVIAFSEGLWYLSWKSNMESYSRSIWGFP